jgi:hypothetical protein
MQPSGSLGHNEKATVTIVVGVAFARHSAD